MKRYRFHKPNGHFSWPLISSVTNLGLEQSSSTNKSNRPSNSKWVNLYFRRNAFPISKIQGDEKFSFLPDYGTRDELVFNFEIENYTEFEKE